MMNALVWRNVSKHYARPKSEFADCLLERLPTWRLRELRCVAPPRSSHLLDARVPTSSKSEFSLLNINLVVRASASASLRSAPRDRARAIHARDEMFDCFHLLRGEQVV